LIVILEPFISATRTLRGVAVPAKSSRQPVPLGKIASAPSRVPGYRVSNERFYRLWNLSLLAGISVVALPAMGILWIMLRLTQGAPIFYKGIRLGKDKKPFVIYKFRTLALDTERQMQQCVLPAGSGLETPMGKFLRDTRLDEIPQLYNILRGDMNFIGPRPVRRGIARKMGRTISGYECRFSVRPGLLGYAQLYMTHRTPKAIRAKFNAHFCRLRAIFWKEPLLMLLTITGMAQKGMGYLGEFINRGRKSRTIGVRCQEARSFFIAEKLSLLVDRYCLRTTQLTFEGAEEGNVDCLLLNINDEALSFLTSAPLAADQRTFLLQRQIKRSRKKVVKARCRVYLALRDKNCNCMGLKIESIYMNSARFSHYYIAYYEPLSDVDAYMIDKYFLGNSILK
jgi:lipopolysaccharide/colanic/teichoic acid biosynthesis glycosyltransferase